MSNASKPPVSPNPKDPDALFGRVVSILEQARGNVARAVNTSMVTAYWLIGREIVQELQGGKGRAAYGEKLISDLAARLTERCGRGFSIPNLKNFRNFYQAYPGRFEIGYPVGSQLPFPAISHPEEALSGIPFPTEGHNHRYQRRNQIAFGCFETPFQGCHLIAGVVLGALPRVGTGRTIGAEIDLGRHQRKLRHA